MLPSCTKIHPFSYVFFSEIMWYTLIALLCVLVSGKLFQKASGTISIYRPHMMSIIFYLFFILMSVVGAVLVVNHVDYHYMIDKLNYESSRIYGFWAVMYTIVAFPIGMLGANRVFHVRNARRLFDYYTSKPLTVELHYNDVMVHRLLVGLSVISVLAVLYVLYVLREVPLLKLFSDGSAVEFAEFSNMTTRNFPGNQYVKNVLALTLTPFFSYVAYGYKLINNTRFNRWWFYILFVASILIVSHNLAKAPLLLYGLGFLFIGVLRGNCLSLKSIIFVVGIILLVLIFLYTQLMSETDIDLIQLFSYNSGIVGRIVLSAGAGMYLMIDLFPNYYHFFGGSSMSSFVSSMLGLDYSDRAARWVMAYVNPDGVAAGVAGVANSLFIGEAWANWGIAGVLLSPIYVGFIIQCLYIFVLRSPKTPFFVALLAFYSYKGSITGGMNDYIYNIQTLVFLSIILFVYGGSKLLSINKNG